MLFPLPCGLIVLRKARGVNLTQSRREGSLDGYCTNLGPYPPSTATPWILRTYCLVSPSRIVHVSGEEVSVVWARHLLLNCEPRLSGNGDHMDTTQKWRGHFVSHCGSGR